MVRVPPHTSVPRRVGKAAERDEMPWFAKSWISLVARGDPAAMEKWYTYTVRLFEGNRGSGGCGGTDVLIAYGRAWWKRRW